MSAKAVHDALRPVTTTEMRAMNEELYSPLAPVSRFSTTDEVIVEASSIYGCKEAASSRLRRRRVLTRSRTLPGPSTVNSAHAVRQSVGQYTAPVSASAWRAEQESLPIRQVSVARRANVHGIVGTGRRRDRLSDKGRTHASSWTIDSWRS